MGFLDDVEQLAAHVLQGNLGAAVGDVGRGINDIVGGPNTSRSGSQGQAAGGMGMEGQGGVIQGIDPLKQQYQASRQAGQDSMAEANCCNRYQYSDGFLLDGVTGTVWKYDQKATVFSEVPLRVNADRQQLMAALIENRLTYFKSQYEREVLSTVPLNARAKKLQEFDDDHLALIRKVAATMRF